ncbi:MAG: serine--tRNA ligase [Candidatus Micrarchaeia archaeon]
MLDIKFIRSNPDIVRADLAKRGDKEKQEWLEDLIAKDKEYRQLLTDLEALRAEKNRITKKIAMALKEGMDTSNEKEMAARLPNKISEMEARVAELYEKIKFYLMRLPNIMHKSVPVGKDEKDNVTIREWGNKREFDFPPKSHVDIIQELDLADIDRAAKISGARFYILKNDLVLLDLALLFYTMNHLMKKGFSPILPPFMMRKEAYEGVVDLSDFETVMYKIEGEDLYNIATAEHPMIAMHMDEILPEESLPLKYVGISPCFRKEAGAHGKDTKGIFRVHQFNQTEQIVICKPEESWNIHEELVRNAEEIFQALGIPYRVVDTCTGDLGTVAARKYDIEAWMPAQNRYREVISCSNCTSYQAVRLNIKYGRVGGEKEYVHTLNATGIATTRAIVAIIENYQNKDGSIAIPEPLVPYVGKEKITRKG